MVNDVTRKGSKIIIKESHKESYKEQGLIIKGSIRGSMIYMSSKINNTNMNSFWRSFFVFTKRSVAVRP